jgi:hypothetical protein
VISWTLGLTFQLSKLLFLSSLITHNAIADVSFDLVPFKRPRGGVDT